MNEIEKNLENLGITLDAGPEPMANYVSVQKAGDIWFSLVQVLLKTENQQCLAGWVKI